MAASQLRSAASALTAHLAKVTFSGGVSSQEDLEKFLDNCYPSLEWSRMEKSDQESSMKWTVVCCAKVMHEGGVGPIRPARIVFAEDGSYSFEVLLKRVKVGSWKSLEGPPVELLDTMLANSGYVLCPGIRSYAASFEEHVRFRTKNLRVWQDPFHRHDCNTCFLWHKPSNVRLASSSPLFDCCAGCKDLYHNLTSLKRRSESSSPGHIEQWLDPSSTRPLKYLSPASQKQRMERMCQGRRNMRRTLFKDDDPLDCSLNAEQSGELSQLVLAIHEKGRDQLQHPMQEAGMVIILYYRYGFSFDIE